MTEVKEPDAKAISEHIKNDKPAVLPELRDFLDILTDDERKGLEADIVASGGAREPLIIWKEKNVIVDGHNRYAICMAHNLPFKTEAMSFPNIEAVKQWMLRNQLNRRNLTPMRISYFRGLLYNQMKQDPKQARVAQDGKTTAAKLGEQFGVNEKTIRRDGNVAAGIEAVGRVHSLESVREKIAAIQNKNLAFRKEELEEIGKVDDPKVQEEAVKVLTGIKQEQAKAKEVIKKNKEAVKPVAQKAKETVKKTPYGVAFCKPAFDSLTYTPSAEVKPPLAKDAVCYMAVPDEAMGKAISLISRWGMTYEGCIVVPMDDVYESAFSNVHHVFMVVATQGLKPFKGKAVNSIVPKTNDPDGTMIKIIESYHAAEKKIDMRRNTTAKGWENLK